MTTPVFLTDSDIRVMAEQGCPLVRPFSEDDIQPASHDLRLSGEQLSCNLVSYRLGDELTERDHTRSTFGELVVPPQMTVHVGLAGTITIPENAIGFVVARSSLTRIGLLIAPVFMNPGYSGVLPITLTNGAAFPVTLVRGVRVAQLICARLSQAPLKSYASRSGKYAGELLSTSLMYTDNDIKAALARVLDQYHVAGSL